MASEPNNDSKFTIFVGDLNYDTEPDALYEYLKPCGKIVRLFMPKGDNKKNRGFAFVEFADAEGIQHALQLREAEATIDDRIPFIRDDSRKDKSKKIYNVEPVRSNCHWNLLLNWEDVDMETIAPAPPELFKDYGVGLHFEQGSPLPVSVFGGIPVTQIEKFEEANLHPILQMNISLCGYTKPTPIQRCAIPVINSRQDMIACAQTGSGKTAAYSLPLVSRLLKTGPAWSKSHRTAFPSVLILSPTRELARQIQLELLKFIHNTFLSASACYGGTDHVAEAQDILNVGCHFLVATPGRLVDEIRRQSVSLSKVSVVVVDEADRMLDMGFEPQLRHIFYQEDLPERNQRQTLMFSATFPSSIQKLVKRFLRNNYVNIAIGEIGAANFNIKQKLMYVPGHLKSSAIVPVLDDTTDGMALVFVARKSMAVHLERILSKQGFSVTSIHGDKKQHERDEALRLFRSGQKPILIATDVASRGLDIQNIAHVINYDLPSNIDDYIHRIGRTGRSGRPGRATSFFCDDDAPLARSLTDNFKQQGQEAPDWLENVVREKLMRDENFSAWDRYSHTQPKQQQPTPETVETSSATLKTKVYASVTIV